MRKRLLALTSVKRWAALMCLLLGMVGVAFAVRVIAATVNTVPKYASDGSLIDSAITEASGNVAIGTTSPVSMLHVQRPDSSDKISIVHSSDSTFWSGLRFGYFSIPTNQPVDIAAVRGKLTDPAHYTRGELQFWTNDDANYQSLQQRMTINGLGNVGIGTTSPTTRLHVVGDVTVTGNIAAKYQDVAEWVPSHESLAAGTVVRASKDAGIVEASRQPYDTAVLGVISSQPGVILGEAAANKVLVAQSGRVRVKVDASFGAIHAGDLLVSSPTRGVAMRSEPVSVGGVELHRPGTLLGKALETWTEGEGEILVLLTLQ